MTSTEEIKVRLGKFVKLRLEGANPEQFAFATALGVAIADLQYLLDENERMEKVIKFRGRDKDHLCVSQPKCNHWDGKYCYFNEKCPYC